MGRSAVPRNRSTRCPAPTRSPRSVQAPPPPGPARPGPGADRHPLPFRSLRPVNTGCARRGVEIAALSCAVTGVLVRASRSVTLRPPTQELPVAHPERVGARVATGRSSGARSAWERGPTPLAGPPSGWTGARAETSRTDDEGAAVAVLPAVLDVLSPKHLARACGPLDSWWQRA